MTIKVLRVIARMNVGGPALQVAGLSKGLARPEFETRLLVGSVGPGEADYLELRAPELSATCIDGLGRSFSLNGDLRGFVQIVREIRKFRPDIVHTHTAKAGVLGRVAARVCGVPNIVHTFHGHLLHGYFSPFVTLAVISVERLLARFTSRIVSVGSHVKNDLLDAGIGRPDQYLVVPPGVSLPVPPSRAEARRILGLPDVGVVVLYVGRLTRIKRPERFVEVARMLANRHPEAVFVVAGGGELLEELRASATGLGDRVRFLGWRSDVEALYSAADVIVLTSDNEGMPVSLIEAAALGVPGVSTDVGSVSDVVVDGETGILTSASTRDLAEAVDRLLSHPALRHRMGMAAARRAERLFNAERLVRDHAALYRSLLSTD